MRRLAFLTIGVQDLVQTSPFTKFPKLPTRGSKEKGDGPRSNAVHGVLKSPVDLGCDAAVKRLHSDYVCVLNCTGTLI